MNEYLISSLEQQLKQDPGSRVFFRLAEEYRKGGAFDRAMQICLEGIEHHPEYLPARVCLGRCRQNLGLLSEAESDFRRVLLTAPDNPHALRGLAHICFARQEWEDALGFFQNLALHDTFDGEVPERITELQRLIAKGETHELQLADPDPESADTLEPERESPQKQPINDGDKHGGDSETAARELEILEPEHEVHREMLLPNQPEDMIPTVSMEDDELEDTYHNFDASSQESESQADPIDLEFERALREHEDTPVLLEGLDEPQLLVHDGATGLTESDEFMLTKGLKHEKMEHYEAAARIYQSLLETHPGEASVGEHLDRVNQFMSAEIGARKKIRLLSNWLDKIKGVYYVS